MSTEKEAFDLLELLSLKYPGEPWGLSPGEFYSPGKAKDGEYSRCLKEGRAAHPIPEEHEPASQRSKEPLLTAEQVAVRLQEAHRQGIAGAELEVLISNLHADLHPLQLKELSKAAAAAVERERQLEQEAARLAAEADRQEIAGGITLDSLLPQATADAISSRCRAMPYSPLLLAVTFLTTIAGLTKQGTKVNGNPATRFTVPTNLFTAAVACSGRKKTPLITALVNEPTEVIRQELTKDFARAMADWKEGCKGVKKDDRPLPPQPAHAVVNDYTGERLAVLLQEHDRRGLAVLVLRDELSGLFGSLNQYRGGRGADEQLLLELFDGGAYTSLRVKGDRAYSRSHVAIFGNIQPAILSQLIGGADPSGKWARFLFCELPETVAELPTVVSPEQEAAIAAAAQHLQDIAMAVYTLPPAEYRLEPAAIAHFARFELQQQQQNLTANLDTVKALHGKAAGKVLRVAGLLHILQRVAEPAMPEPHIIPLVTLQNAILLVEVLNQWAIGFHAEAAAAAVGGIDNMMRRVHNASANADKQWVSWRDFSRCLSPKQRERIDRIAFEQVVHRLAGSNRQTTDKTDKPTSRWGETGMGTGGKLQYRAICGPI